jgi:hypothetical protein
MISRYYIQCVLVAVACGVGLAGVTRGQPPKDILWFGNSFTGQPTPCCGTSRSVPDIFRDIATAAGQPTPRNRNAAANGQSLQWHLTNNVSVITTGIVASEKWEHVVLQDHSTWPTHIGNLSQHLSSSLALYQKVALHSPNVVPVMYETWARGYPNSYYAGANPSFPGGPAQMQQELRDGYRMSTENINTTVGMELAKLAPAGDAWELANFPANFYDASDPSHYHAQNRGALLNALILYGTIYDDPTTSDIPLSGVLSSLGLSAADGPLLTGLADATLVPEPGSLTIFGLAMALLASARRVRR